MRETYSPGYGDSAEAFMRRRTAGIDASFPTPLLTSGMRLLDCGCGPGTITVGLARLVAPAQVIGIDWETAQCKQVERQARQDGLAISFEQSSVYALPFDANRFDVMFAHGLLSHLAEPAAALAELKRVLKPHGLIAVRDADWSGSLAYPPDPVIDAGVNMLRQTVKANGGDPEIGRKLGALLRSTGFVDVRLSASYEIYDPVFLTGFFAKLVPRHQFAEEPFLAQPWCEAIGRN